MPASGISGAIGSLKLENISLIEIERNERYILYRSSRKMIGTTGTLLPGEIITGEPAPGYDVMQMTNFGSLMSEVNFSPEGVKILVRQAKIGQKAKQPQQREEFRRLIYSKYADKDKTIPTQIGIGLKGYKEGDKFE